MKMPEEKDETRGAGGSLAGVPVYIIAVVVVIVVAVAVAGLFLLGGGEGKSESPQVPEDALMFDDFEDGTLGSNFANTSAGMMGGYAPDGKEYEFVQVNGSQALKMTVDVPQDKWSGYWSFLRPDDTQHDKIYVYIGNGRDLSDYDEIRMAMKSDSSLSFKMEVQDTLCFTSAGDAAAAFSASENNSDFAMDKYGSSPEPLAQDIFNKSIEDIATLSSDAVFDMTSGHNGEVNRTVGSSWEVVTVPFSELTGEAPGLSINDIRQINFVFEGEAEGALYLDWIAFA